MLRLAVTPRWIALALLALVLMVACVFLGRWQFTRTQDILAAERAALAAPVSATELAAPGAGIESTDLGRTVIVTGRFTGDQVAIANRASTTGAAGQWVVAGVKLEDGSEIAVNRGWVASGDLPAAEGEVRITGIYQPDEEFYAGAPVDGPTLSTISATVLAERWGTALRPGFVTLVSQEPSVSSPVPVPATVETAGVPFPWQNFGYAFQWWAFAIFVAVIYLRLLWVNARRLGESADGAGADSTTVFPS